MNTTSADALPDRVYVEQVRSLYLNLLSAGAMWLAFAINFWLVYRSAPRTDLLLLGIAGILASTTRIAVTAFYRDHALTAALDQAAARRLERLFSIPYLSFSALLGAFAADVFARTAADLHMLTICVVVGYCAGVATNCGLRPRLAIPSMLLAVGPAILAAGFKGEATYLGLAVIASGFVFSASRSIQERYDGSRAEIGQRLASISLARRDALTALPNRLALQEYFAEQSNLVSSARAIAVHYLDLDGFKPVNDRHGHAMGDALLLAVANRLRGAVRSGDIVARMGGDEFAVIQFGLHHAEEAKLLARRIASTIDQPFEVDGLTLAVSASVGTVVSHDRSESLDSLLRTADAELYAAKGRRKHGVTMAMIA